LNEAAVYSEFGVLEVDVMCLSWAIFELGGGVVTLCVEGVPRSDEAWF